MNLKTGETENLACTNAAPGAVPPSAVAAPAGAATGSHPATLLIPRRHRMSAPAGQSQTA